MQINVIYKVDESKNIEKRIVGYLKKKKKTKLQR